MKKVRETRKRGIEVEGNGKMGNEEGEEKRKMGRERYRSKKE